jgi:hypothetical protein
LWRFIANIGRRDWLRGFPKADITGASPEDTRATSGQQVDFT